MRYAIKLINSLNIEELNSIDPSKSHFRTKLPLLLFASGSGLLSSMTTSFIKGVSEQLNSDEGAQNLGRPMIYILLILVGVSLLT